MSRSAFSDARQREIYKEGINDAPGQNRSDNNAISDCLCQRVSNNLTIIRGQVTFRCIVSIDTELSHCHSVRLYGLHFQLRESLLSPWQLQMSAFSGALTPSSVTDTAGHCLRASTTSAFAGDMPEHRWLPNVCASSCSFMSMLVDPAPEASTHHRPTWCTTVRR